MSLTITKELQVPLLARKRVTGTFDHSGKGTPKNEEIAQEIATKLKVDATAVKIQHIYTHFGDSKSKIIAHVYNTPGDLDKVETFNKKKKEKK